ERAEPRRPCSRFGLGQGLRVDITDPDQLDAVTVLLERIEVIRRDPAASHQREPDLAVSDERLGDEHGSRRCREDGSRRPKCKLARWQGLPGVATGSHENGAGAFTSGEAEQAAEKSIARPDQGCARSETCILEVEGGPGDPEKAFGRLEESSAMPERSMD